MVIGLEASSGEPELRDCASLLRAGVDQEVAADFVDF